jgi:hypothetical protein
MMLKHIYVLQIHNKIKNRTFLIRSQINFDRKTNIGRTVNCLESLKTIKNIIPTRESKNFRVIFSKKMQGVIMLKNGFL